MKTLVVKGIITATSDKQNEEFKAKTPTKSIYFRANEKYSALLKEFGLEEYSGVDKETKEENKFFIVKASAQVNINGEKIDCTIEGETMNFHSDEKEVGIALIQNKHSTGTIFTRCYAIKGVIDYNAAIDPFADFDEDIELPAEFAELDLDEEMEERGIKVD